MYTDEYFFTTDHCQSVQEGGNVPEHFVSCTAQLPMKVVPRPSLPDGLITNLKEYLMIFHDGEKEIPNPNPKYQPNVEGR